MHGAGNSFVIIDNMDGGLEKARLSFLAKELCAEYNSDGILVTVPDAGEDADFGMLYYNADGSLGEMCGNGARCIARYGYERGFSADPDRIRIRATAGVVLGRRISEELYEVRLNDPSVAEPVRAAEACGREYTCSYIELGDPGIPHAVLLADEDDFSDMDALRERGRQLRNSTVFPKGANVTFAVKTGENSVRAITFERGVEDFTLACGTGCGATAISLAMWGLIPGNRAEIDMPGGHLSVGFNFSGGRFSNLLLTGPTAYIK